MSLYTVQTRCEPVTTPFTGINIIGDISRIGELKRFHGRMVMALALAVFMGLLLWFVTSLVGSLDAKTVAAEAESSAELLNSAVIVGQDPEDVPGIAPVFSSEVKRWEKEIIAWAGQFGIDPDAAAVIMQIESCGDPQAVSIAGAQGLFQVMPFHFVEGEDTLNPDTNARRGLSYFAERLAQTGGDFGKAFAGYNGGHVAAAGEWDSWVQETRDYYVWATGIYSEAKSGLETSPTLQRWLQAGGASLCRQAESRLNFR